MDTNSNAPPLPPPPPPPAPSTTSITMDLPTTTLAERDAHDKAMFELEARRASALLVDVPTLSHLVADALRGMNEPIRLFGENNANVRDRLRLCLGRLEVMRRRQEQSGGAMGGEQRHSQPQSYNSSASGLTDGGGGEEEATETANSTKYTYAPAELISAREDIAVFSLGRARARLQRERMRRWGAAKRKRLLADISDDDTAAATPVPRLIPYDDTHLHNNSDRGDNCDSNDLTMSDRQKRILDELDALDGSCKLLHRTLRDIALEGSQYGDTRPLSAICTSRPVCSYSTNCFPSHNNHVDGKDDDENENENGSDQHAQSKNNPAPQTLIATGGWSGGIKLWDGSSPSLDLLASRNTAHEDRIMGIAMRPFPPANTTTANGSDDAGGGTLATVLATASIDRTCRLWNVRRTDSADSPNNANTNEQRGRDDDDGAAAADMSSPKYSIEPTAILDGHQARLCSVAFHPSGRYVGTTSFDHTWRLWDVETSSTATGDSSGSVVGKKKELLLQDGHWKEVYGIGFHGDGSIVSTGDFGSVVQVWDLRTGKSVCNFLGHAGRVLCNEFHPNGFQLATAGDDGTIKIWDLRQRRRYASLPAHSRLISQLKFSNDSSETMVSGQQNGEFLTSCSFDGTGKVWSTRDWRLLSTLRGHEGKVMGIDVLDGSVGGTGGGIVTCGYDKTMKIWR